MLFCITATYTAKALNAMRENPSTDRQAAVEKMVAAAGGKVVGFYYTLNDGPGVHVIIDADPIAAAAVVGTAASTDSVKDIRMTRLWTNDEVAAVRKKRVEIHGSYKPPAQ